ncbi:translation factor, SUA5 domain [Metamycoplasma alkalescens]|nr:translation factor, SUA5 domain [Metamycoplasma alkalescens]
MPNQKKLLEFLEKNGPVYMSSCNLSNAPICKTIESAKEVFPEITNIYNFGEMSQIPSQIIRVEDEQIIRG